MILTDEEIYQIKKSDLKKGELNTKYRISKRVAQAEHEATLKAVGKQVWGRWINIPKPVSVQRDEFDVFIDSLLRGELPG